MYIYSITKTKRPTKRIGSDAYWLVIIFLAALLAGLFVVFAHADVPQLQRRTGPPVVEVSCQDRLGDLKFNLWTISRNEAVLWSVMGDKKQAKFFTERAKTVQDTHDLIPSTITCTPYNYKELDIMLASWQYQYAVDYGRLHGAGK